MYNAKHFFTSGTNEGSCMASFFFSIAVSFTGVGFTVTAGVVVEPTARVDDGGSAAFVATALTDGVSSAARDDCSSSTPGSPPAEDSDGARAANVFESLMVCRCVRDVCAHSATQCFGVYRWWS